MTLVERTRTSPHLELGVSTRGAICLYKAVQARAYLAGRHFVTPDDIQALVGPVFGHRVWVKAHYEGGLVQREQAMVILAELVDSVPVPR
jgi:MoxR-like ATPase